MYITAFDLENKDVFIDRCLYNTDVVIISSRTSPTVFYWATDAQIGLKTVPLFSFLHNSVKK